MFNIINPKTGTIKQINKLPEQYTVLKETNEGINFKTAHRAIKGENNTIYIEENDNKKANQVCVTLKDLRETTPELKHKMSIKIDKISEQIDIKWARHIKYLSANNFVAYFKTSKAFYEENFDSLEYQWIKEKEK